MATTVLCLVGLLAASASRGNLFGFELPVVRLLFNICAIATVGTLLAAGYLTPEQKQGTLSRGASSAVRAALGWACAWTAVAAAGWILASADTSWSDPRAQALLLSSLFAGLLAVRLRRHTSRRDCQALLLVALAGITPSLYAGRSGHAPDEQLTGILMVHVFAALLWCGGLLAVVLHLRRYPSELGFAAARYSRLALCCLSIIALTGPALAWTHLGGSLEQWSSRYGQFVVIKAIALAVLAALGWWHRRSTLAGLAYGRRRAFLRLAVGELVVMGCVVAVAAALAGIPADVLEDTHADGSAAQDLRPLALALLTQWQPAPVTAALILLALGAYLHAARQLTARGQNWPSRRSAAAVFAAGTALLALCGGVAVYSTSLLSVRVIQYLGLLLLVPLLVSLSRPVTLVRRWRGGATLPGPVLRLASDPARAGGAVMLLTFALFGTPLLTWTLAYPAIQMLANLSALAVGFAFWLSVLTADQVMDADQSARVTEPTPHPAASSDRTAVLVVIAVFLAAFGAVLATSDALVATFWFDLPADFGGGIEFDQQFAALAAWWCAGCLGVAGFQQARREGSRSSKRPSVRPQT